MADAAAELVARHYSDRQGQSTQERKRSDILQLRELNNWVKSSLISQFTRPGDYVLDLACGKGGDLPKWKEAGVGFYCGVDIAVESVRKDARERYNRARYAFPAALLVADAFEAPLGRALQPHAPFDVVSCQFALHYAFSSERRARRALQNVAEALAPGGAFVGTTLDADVLVRKLRARPGMRIANQVFSCVFGPRFASKALDAGASPFGLEYRFTLADAVEDVPEYLVHRPTLVQLAREYGLHLVLWEVRGACSALCLAVSHTRLTRPSPELPPLRAQPPAARLRGGGPRPVGVPRPGRRVRRRYGESTPREVRPLTRRVGGGASLRGLRVPQGGRAGGGQAKGTPRAAAHTRLPRGAGH